MITYIKNENCSILVTPYNPDVPHLEDEINNLVYKLYDLTPQEIKIVESRN